VSVYDRMAVTSLLQSADEILMTLSDWT